MPVVELANGDVVVIGGDAEGNAPSRAVEIYSREHLPVAGYLKCLSEGRSAHSAVRLLDGRVLVTNGAIAGTSSSYAELFDPSAPTCTQAGAMKANRTGAPAVLLQDGKVLVAGGGASAADALASAEIYAPDTDTWNDAPSLNEARRFAQTVVLDDGRVLIVGGEGPSGILASAEIYAVRERDPCEGVVCDGETACKEAGVCDPATGSCTYANKPDGTSCTGGSCVNGVCVADTPDGGVDDPDAGSVEDAGPDAAEPGDAGSGDAEAPSDAGDEPDVGGGDAGRDAASGDADGEGDELDPDVEAIIGGGYSCRAAGGVADRGSLAAALMLAGAVLARRRRA